MHALEVRESGRARLELFLAVGDEVREVGDGGEGFCGEDDLLGRGDYRDGYLRVSSVKDLYSSGADSRRGE